MSEVFGPYHFVPLSKWVYQPEWAHLVSHDHPFENGLSGRIKLTLRNESPLCVGGPREKDSNAVKWLRDPTGKPIIPGTSIKGMLRNVLEIATFAKFQAVDDVRFSFREVPPQHYYSKEVNLANVKPVWMRFNNNSNSWEITRCKMAKVKLEDLERAFGIKLKNSMSISDKYSKLSLNRPVYASDIKVPTGKNMKLTVGKVAASPHENSVEGYVVFSDNRPGPEGFTEFAYFFYEPEEKVEVCELKKELDFAHSHREKELEDLFQRYQNKQLGVPLFAVYSPQNNLKYIGLTKALRISFKNSVMQLVSNHYGVPDGLKLHEHYMFDFPELLFGTVSKLNHSLRSRVFFTDLLATTKPDFRILENVVLSNPKATFVNGYVEQSSAAISSYMQDNAVPAGWKRYVAKSSNIEEISHATMEQMNAADKPSITTSPEYVDANTEFTGELVFHNLTEIELGALLWSITLGSTKGTCHSLGYGKPYGLGLVTVKPELRSVQINTGNKTETAESYYVERFVSHMNGVHPGVEAASWGESPQIQNLIAMASPKDNRDVRTEYMSLNQYGEAKQKHKVLGAFRGILRNERLQNSQISESHKVPQGRLVKVLEKARKALHNAALADNPSADTVKIPEESKAEELFRILEKELALAQPQDKAVLMRNFLTACANLDTKEMSVKVFQGLSIKVKEIGFGKAKKKERAAADKKLYQNFIDKFGDALS